MFASELLLPNKAMDTAIPFSTFTTNVLSEIVFLHVVELEVAEWLAIKAADHREAVAAVETVLQECLLVLSWSVFAPGVRYSLVVHPIMQDVNVIQLTMMVFKAKVGQRGHRGIGS